MPSSIIARAAKQAGIDEKETESRWSKAKEIAIRAGYSFAEDKEAFWAYVMGVFKKSMGFSEGEYQVLESALDDACADVDTNPTPAQIESGNYKKGHCTVNGLNITIENPKGSKRSGVAPDGTEWETELKSHYGYVKGTVGRDGDHVDVFLGPTAETTDTVYIIDQLNEKKKFDEHKCMIGYKDADDALAGYLANYEKGWRGAGAVTPMPIEDFQAWIISDDTKKPTADKLNLDGMILEQAATTEATGKMAKLITEDSGGTLISMPTSIPITLKGWTNRIEESKSFDDVSRAFFNGLEVVISEYERDHADTQEAPATKTTYKNAATPFGLKSSGVKTREKLNNKCKEIIARAKTPADLSEADLAALVQYSGKGGLTENSQFEYYTPTHVAEGVWDMLKSNGFANGNVLEPSCGAGVFINSKTPGVTMTGVELDATSAKVAELLHPEDAVTNESFEEHCMRTPDDQYDAVIGNVPFGDARGPSRHLDAAYKEENLIERYFMLRTLDKVRPGGLVALIVPIDIIGSKGQAWEIFRQKVSKKAEFLGAHKLPSKTFKSQGTDTVVDIIILKKHPKTLLNKIDNLPVEILKTANVYFDEFIEGRYWKGEGLKYIMGKYIPKNPNDFRPQERVDGDIDNASMKAKLAARFNSRINWTLLDETEPVDKNYTEGDRRDINGKMMELRNGEWESVVSETSKNFIDKAKYGAATLEDLTALFTSEKGMMTITAAQAFNCFLDYRGIMPKWAQDLAEAASSQDPALSERIWRGSLIGLLIERFHNESIDGKSSETDCDMIQELLTKEISLYGLPKNGTGKLNILGASMKSFGIFLSAVDEKGNFSDLVKGKLDTTGNALQFDPSNPQAVVEHLWTREGIRELDLETFNRFYSGEKLFESLSDVAELGTLAISPNGMITPLSKATSGLVYEKISALLLALGNEKDPRIIENYKMQIETMQARRKYTLLDNVSPSMQQAWINKRYIVEFVRERGYRDAKCGYYVQDPQGNRVQNQGKTLREIGGIRFVEDYGNDSEILDVGNGQGFDYAFQKYLNGKPIGSSSPEEYKKQYRDEKNKLEDMFGAWLQQHTDSKSIEEDYNRCNNAHVPEDYDMTPIKLALAGDKVVPKTYQNAAIRKLSEDGRGILAFDVGLGKTYTALGLYAHNTELGRSKKTCIVVPNSVLSNWYQETNQFLKSMDDVLFVGLKPELTKDGKFQYEPIRDEKGVPVPNRFTVKLKSYKGKENRFEQMWQIPQGNMSLVVMTQEDFSTIPLKKASVSEIVTMMGDRNLLKENEVNELIKSDGKQMAAKKVSYADDKKITKQAERDSDTGTAKKEELPYFEDMGITDVIVDEAHGFKNNMHGGENTNNIKYLPAPTPSQRGIDMKMKLEILRKRNNGRGAYLLSATPVTNSPLEIYNMLSFVAPFEEFEKRRIFGPDDFIKNYGKIENKKNANVAAEQVQGDTLTGFQNLGGLRNLFTQYCIMKTAKDVNLKIPNAVQIERPVTMTGAQQKAYETIRLEAVVALKETKKAKSEREARHIFTVMRDLERITTDMDLFNREMTFVFAKALEDRVDDALSKMPKSRTFDDSIGEGAERQKIKTEVKFVKDTKLVGDTYVVVVHAVFEEDMLVQLQAAGIESGDIGHPLTPKYAALVEEVEKRFVAGGKQIIFSEEKMQHGKICRILVHYIPMIRKLIAIINADEASGDKIQKIADAFNSGDTMIIVANKKAEVGLNLNKGTVAVHHLTFPWTPASLQQREGRAVRQGNPVENVDIVSYAAEGSFDSYRQATLASKSNWIGELLAGSGDTMDNPNDVDGAIAIALLPESERPAALAKQKADLEKKIADEVAKKKRAAANTLQSLSAKIEKLAKLPEDKATEKEEYDNKVTRAMADIKRHTSNIEYWKGEKDKEKTDAAKRELKDSERALRLAQAVLDGLDAKYAELKTRHERNIGADKLQLKAAQKKGLVNFDPSLIDNPTDCIVSSNGTVMQKGQTWQAGDAASGNLTIFKIVEISTRDKTFVGEYVTKGNRRTNSISFDAGLKQGMIQVNYSESELLDMTYLTKEYTYEDLKQVPEDYYRGHKDQFKYAKGINYHYVAIDTAHTAVKFVTGDDTVAPGWSILYPVIQDAGIKKLVCEAALADRGANEGDASNLLDGAMSTLFGYNWEKVSQEYGNNATQEQVNSALADLLDAKISEQNYAKDISLADKYYNKGSYVKGYSWKDVYRKSTEITGLGDNKLSIMDWADDWSGAKYDEFMALYKAELQKIQDAKNAELRSDPNFKEVPAAIADMFDALDIRAFINGEIVTAVRHGKYKSTTTTIDPYSKVFMSDRRARKGKLYRFKEILKSRYGAMWVDDAGKYSETWAVPVSTNLEEVVKLLGGQ